MPRGKKNTTPTAPSAPVTVSAEVSPVATTKLETLLLKLRNTCRAHGLQSWNKQSLCDQIYQDLLFIYHLPRLLNNGQMTLDCDEISGGKLTTISYATLLTLKNDPQTMSNIFRRLWRALQTSIVGSLFTAREFAMFSIEKDEKKAAKYYKLLVALFEDMNSVVLTDYDSNAGYTYFKKDLNKGTAKTFGQFYTPSAVLKSVVGQVKPKSGQMIIDTNCGSCSFLQEVATYIMREEKVDKHTAFANLYGIEVERDIYTEGVMNIFINFGIIPNMETHIREEDAFLVLLVTSEKYGGGVANPPFGATVASFKESYYTTVLEQKGKKMVKKVIVNPAVKNPIPFPNESESAFLFFQLIPVVLEDGARMGVVMSMSILEKSYILEWFLKLCSVEKIIINPAGTFKEQGTGIETISFIYTKGKPTTTISVVMLGDEDKVIRTLTMDQIREAGWKLDIKGTANVETVMTSPSEYPIIKLGDIVDALPGQNLSPTEQDENPGPYPVVSGGRNPSKTYYKYNREANTISISKFGSYAGYVRWNDTRYWSLGSMTLVNKLTDKCNIRYLYYYLSLGNEKLYKLQRPGPTTNFYWVDAIKLDIHLPPISIQDQIVTTLERIFAPGTTDLADTLKLTDRAMDLVLKDPMGGLLEQVVEAIRLARDTMAHVAHVKAQMAAVVKASMASTRCNKYVLSDLAHDNPESITKTDKLETINYIDLGSVKEGIVSSSQLIPFSEKPSRAQRKIKDGDIIWGGVRPLSKSYAFIETAFDNMIGSSGFIVVRNKDTTKVLSKYLYYALTTDQCVNYLNNHSTGASYPAFKSSTLMAYEVIIPSIDIQTETILRLSTLESTLTALETSSKQSEDNARFILESHLNTA